MASDDDDDKGRAKRDRGDGTGHKTPESSNAFRRMVSLTAANTRRMLEVSVAWVRLEGVGRRPGQMARASRQQSGRAKETKKTQEDGDLGVGQTHWGYRGRCARFTWLNRQSRYLAARLTSLPPE